MLDIKYHNVKIQNNRCQNVKYINSDQTSDECRLLLSRGRQEESMKRTASSGPEVFVDHLATLAQHGQKHQPSRAITCDHVQGQGQQCNLHVIGIE